MTITSKTSEIILIKSFNSNSLTSIPTHLYDIKRTQTKLRQKGSTKYSRQQSLGVDTMIALNDLLMNTNNKYKMFEEFCGCECENV